MSYDAPTRAFVLVVTAPNGSERVIELFEADSPEDAAAYAEQHNKTELDKHLRRFRIAGRFLVSFLFRSDDPEYADAPYYTGLCHHVPTRERVGT